MPVAILALANREDVRIFTIGDAVKRHANALAHGGTALLQVNIEGTGLVSSPAE